MISSTLLFVDAGFKGTIVNRESWINEGHFKYQATFNWMKIILYN